MHASECLFQIQFLKFTISDTPVGVKVILLFFCVCCKRLFIVYISGCHSVEFLTSVPPVQYIPI